MRSRELGKESSRAGVIDDFEDERARREDDATRESATKSTARAPASVVSWLCGSLHRFSAKNHVVNLEDELDDLRGQ